MRLRISIRGSVRPFLRPYVTRNLSNAVFSTSVGMGKAREGSGGVGRGGG